MRGRAGSAFTDLGPYEFRWVEFWGAGRKFMHMKARMMRHKIFYLATAMNGMLIPHQHNRSLDVHQQMCEKPKHLLTADRLPIGLKAKLNLTLSGSYTYSTNQVQTLIMFQTRANRRRLAARGPRAFERRDQ